MKKTILVGINAKYIHSNVAIRYLHKYALKQLGIGDNSQEFLVMCEYSINQETDYILSQIVEKKPSIVGFSMYLWNIDLVRKLSRSLKLLLPEVIIIYGGPEVSYLGELEFENNHYVDYVIQGEGEQSFYELFCYLNGQGDFPKTGIVYKTEHIIIQKPGVGIDLDALPFTYDAQFDGLENRILYYETSRGCPFHCQYCLSSIEKGVRFKSLDKTFQELQRFLDKKVMQVKFVDRTFNAKESHALGIMNYIIEHDNGMTNFHFEVAPEMISEEFLITLGKAREGLFQLEMGVQSTNAETLKIIDRNNDLQKIKKISRRIKLLKNTHIHIDLIAGLPRESFNRFGESFDFVYLLKPDQLQLGFLKVLKGAGLMSVAKDYGLLYRNYAPYEVLCTDAISYEELEMLKLVEEMVELFYNSGQFQQTIEHYINESETPFNGFLGLAKKWKQQGMHHKKHQKLDLFQFLFDALGASKIYASYLFYDYCLNENPKRTLPWMKTEHVEASLQRFLLDTVQSHSMWLTESDLYTTKQLSRMYHIDCVNLGDFETTGNEIKRIYTQHVVYSGEYILINYERRDFIHNNGEVIIVVVEKAE